MNKYASYSNVFLIKRYTRNGWNPSDETFCDDVLVVDNPDEALRLINEMNEGDDAKNHPFADYGFQAVPYKHHN